jgi:DNA-binding NarL/FixJ family response regulator
MEPPIPLPTADPTTEIDFVPDEPRFVVLSPELRRLVADPLPRRELQVLRLIARGLTNRQIGEVLGISEATVKAYCRQLFRRLRVCNRTEAAIWASRHGMLIGL